MKVEKGDISNELAPALAIDVDGLIIFTEKKFFGLSKSIKLNHNAIMVCEHHFKNGRMIYLLAHRKHESEVRQIEQILDDADFPYTRLYHVPDDNTRESILGRSHVHMYFYLDKLHGATHNKRKEKRIFNITETYF